MLRRPSNRDEQDEQLLARLIAQHPDLAQAIELSQDFAQILRERSPERLEPWLTRAVRSQLGALVGFALRLGEDYEAVNAGVTLEWSNGQVFGQINRLKMLKRQMYGRALVQHLRQKKLDTRSHCLQQPSHLLGRNFSPRRRNHTRTSAKRVVLKLR